PELGIMSRPIPEHHWQARGMLLIVGAGERHAQAVGEDRFVARLDPAAGTGPVLRGHDPEVADLRNEAGVRSEISRRCVRAGYEARNGERRREETLQRGVPENRDLMVSRDAVS